MASDVKNLLQDIADAVEGHDAKGEALSAAKAGYDAALKEFNDAGTRVASLQATLNELLGHKQGNRAR